MEPWTHSEIVDLQAALRELSFPEELLGADDPDAAPEPEG